MHEDAPSPASGPDCPFESDFEYALTHKQIAHSGQTLNLLHFVSENIRIQVDKMQYSPQGEPHRPQKSQESFSVQLIQLTPLIPSFHFSLKKLWCQTERHKKSHVGDVLNLFFYVCAKFSC